MGQEEPMQHSIKGLDSKNVEVAKELPVSHNFVQVAVMELWAKKHPEEFADRNAVASLWISSGLSEKFGNYVKANPDEKIDLNNKSQLESLLKKIEEPTVH